MRRGIVGLKLIAFGNYKSDRIPPLQGKATLAGSAFPCQELLKVEV
jgi:hypothetical protein